MTDAEKKPLLAYPQRAYRPVRNRSTSFGSFCLPPNITKRLKHETEPTQAFLDTLDSSLESRDAVLSAATASFDHVPDVSRDRAFHVVLQNVPLLKPLSTTDNVGVLLLQSFEHRRLHRKSS